MRSHIGRLLLVLFAAAAMGAFAMHAVVPSADSAAYPCPTCGPPYPWWTGVELANSTALIKIEGFLAFTCPDCRQHWFGIVKPLLAKYKNEISFVHQPFALPYQTYSYDCTQAAYAVYRLLYNNVSAWMNISEAMFNGQDFFFNAFTLSQEQVWTATFAVWAQQLGIPKDLLFAAMAGNITTANYDAWYQARYCRQRTFIGAPSFVVNEWLPFELQLDQWNLTQWESYIDSALSAIKTGKAAPRRR